MSGWGDLIRELDAWGEAGREATFWWRDDDASADTPALRELRHRAQMPIALAVIPAALEPDFADALADWPLASVLQHGYAHRNRAPSSAKKSEFPDADAMAQRDLMAGFAHLSQTFGAHFHGILVPPWNRIGPACRQALPDWNFRGLSRFGPRQPGAFLPGLIEVNTHVDLVDWRGDRGFPGEAVILAKVIEHLRQRRLGLVDPYEATGLLTHHLVHQKETWRFLDNLQDCLRGHGCAAFLDAAQLFAGDHRR